MERWTPELRAAFVRLETIARADGIRDTALPGPDAAYDVALLQTIGAVVMVGRHVYITAQGREWLEHMEKAA